MIQLDVKALGQDIIAIIPAHAGKLAIGLVKHGRTQLTI